MEWIPVTVRLPDPGDEIDILASGSEHWSPGDKEYRKPRRVINLTVERREEGIEHYLIATGIDNLHEFCHENGEYTHWMPIVKPPIMESKKIQTKLLSKMYTNIFNIQE